MKDKTLKCLLKIGYKTDSITIIPVSALKGVNLVTGDTERDELMPWYKGLTFIESLDKLKAPMLLDKKPLRIPLQDAYRIRGVGYVVAGRVATGTLVPGMQVYFAPAIEM